MFTFYIRFCIKQYNIKVTGMNIYSILKKNKIDLDVTKFFHFCIIDKLGKTILEANSKSQDKVKFISPGLYHIEINQDNGILQQKIII